jgi:hypothetical protein
MPTAKLSAVLTLQLIDEQKPSDIPIKFTTSYTQKALIDLAYSGAVTNQAINDGTITTPAVILVMVDTGKMDIVFDASGPGTGIIRLNMDVVPAPTDKAFFLYKTNDPSATTLYVTTAGPATGRVWILQ